jgi:hypothetical protein
VTLPWSIVFRAINDALNSRFLEVVPGGPVSWPCEAQSAAAVEFRLPAAYGTSLIFKVSVEAKGLPPEARKALRSELAKAVGEFTEPG